MLASKVGLLLLMALGAYVLFGGADLGGGIWDLLARGPRREAQRQAIARAMGPVWEANHVWLIFALVLLFTGFPRAFAHLTVGLFVPLHVVLLGIVLRGAAFAFRSAATTARVRRAWGFVFGGASMLAAFSLGLSLAAASGAAAGVDGTATPSFPPFVRWATRPLSLGMGTLAVCLSAYLAAVYMTIEARGDASLQEDFRKRALWSGAAVLAASALLLPIVRRDAPHLWAGLAGRALWTLVVPGAVAAALGALALWHRRYHLARLLAAAQALALLGGWGYAQWPYLVYPHLTLAEGAAPPSTLKVVVQAVPVGMAILLPALWLLFAVFKVEGAAASTGDGQAGEAKPEEA